MGQNDIFCVEYQQAFQEFTGIDPLDYSYGSFTHEQQVDRYARQLVFWELQRPLMVVDGPNQSIDLEIHRGMFVSNAILTLRNKMQQFPLGLLHDINDRVVRIIAEIDATKHLFAELQGHKPVVDYLRTTPHYARAEKEKAKATEAKAKANAEATERADAMAQLLLEEEIEETKNPKIKKKQGKSKKKK